VQFFRGFSGIAAPTALAKAYRRRLAPRSAATAAARTPRDRRASGLLWPYNSPVGETNSRVPI